MIKILSTGTSATIGTNVRNKRPKRISGRLGEGVRDEQFELPNVTLHSQWLGNQIKSYLICKNSSFVRCVTLEFRFRTPQKISELAVWTEAYTSLDSRRSIKKAPGTLSSGISRKGAWAIWLSESEKSEGMLFYQSPPTDYPIIFHCSKIDRTLLIIWQINRSFENEEQLHLSDVNIQKGLVQQSVTQWRRQWKHEQTNNTSYTIKSAWCSDTEIQSPADLHSSINSLNDSKASLDCFAMNPNYASKIGDWIIPIESFRDKMGQNSRFIYDNGMAPGLRFAPFLVSRKSTIANQHPDWLVLGSNGQTLITSAYNESRDKIHVLDITRQEVVDYLKEILTVMRDRWGFRVFFLERISDIALLGVRNNQRISVGKLATIGIKIIRETLGSKTFIIGCDVPLLSTSKFFNAQVTAPYFNLKHPLKTPGSRKEIMFNTSVILHRSEWSNVGWYCSSGLLHLDLFNSDNCQEAESLIKSVIFSSDMIIICGDPRSSCNDTVQRISRLISRVKRSDGGQVKQISYSAKTHIEPLILCNAQGRIGIFNISNRTNKVVLNRETLRNVLGVSSNLKAGDSVVFNSPEIHVSILPYGSRIFDL